MQCARLLSARSCQKIKSPIHQAPCFWAQNPIHCLYVFWMPHCGHIKHGIESPVSFEYQFPTCELKIDHLPKHVRVRPSRSHLRKPQKLQECIACVEMVRVWIYKLRQLVAFTPHLPDSLSFTKSTTNETNVRVRLPRFSPKISGSAATCCRPLLRGAKKL